MKLIPVDSFKYRKLTEQKKLESAPNLHYDIGDIIENKRGEQSLYLGVVKYYYIDLENGYIERSTFYRTRASLEKLPVKEKVGHLYFDSFCGKCDTDAALKYLRIEAIKTKRETKKIVGHIAIPINFFDLYQKQFADQVDKSFPYYGDYSYYMSRLTVEYANNDRRGIPTPQELLKNWEAKRTY